MEVYVQDCNTLIVQYINPITDRITAQATIRLNETNRAYNVYGWYLHTLPGHNGELFESMGNLSPDKYGFNPMFLQGALGGACSFVALKGKVIRGL